MRESYPESRRGSVTLRAQVVTTIRPDTIFVPYHWAGRQSINQVTIAAQDPVSKIPEYKVCAVRIAPAPPPAGVSALPVHAASTATGVDPILVKFSDPPRKG